MVDSVMEQFRNFMRGIRLSEPQIPFVSNLTGDWITPSQCKDVNYWTAHLRHTVRFAQGLETIGQKGRYALIELGPGRTLSTFANQQLRVKGSIAYSAMRHPQDTAPELRTTFATLGRLWTLGMSPNWRNFYADEMRCCVPLPTYPFERKRYWIAPVPGGVAHRKKGAPTLEGHLYNAVWMPAPLLTQQRADAGHWIILADQLGIGRECARILKKTGQSVAIVHGGSSSELLRQGEYQVNAQSEQDLTSLLQQLLPIHESSVKVLHCWSLSKSRVEASDRNFFHEAQENGTYSLLSLTRAMAQQSYAGQWQLSVISNGAVQLNGGEELAVEQAVLQAAIMVIPQEYRNIRCRLIDIGKQTPNAGAIGRLSEQIISEAAQKEMQRSSVVAYRGLQRWTRSYASLEMGAGANDCRLNGKKKTYLITGGLGTLGLVLARHLADACPCHIVLTTRTKFPDRKFWNNPGHLIQEDRTVREKIETLNDIERLGATVLVATADVADRIQMETLIARVEAELGALDGVIHLAGITGEKALRLSSDLQPFECEAQFRPKVEGCYVLKDLLHDRTLDFCLLFSSTASVLGGPGMLAYAAASCFLDACAASWCLNGQRWISINWDAWVPEKTSRFLGMHESALDRYALPYSTALNLLDLITAKVPGGAVVVSSHDVNARVDEWTKEAFPEDGEESQETHSRPELQTDYVAPETPLQKEIAAIWSAALGIEQIGIHDNLFELGGNSLIGLRIVARLKKDLGIEIPVSALFEGPTVSTLSQLIEKSGRTELYTVSRNRGELRRHSRSAARSGATA
jgi:acyl transferase domain-containing protein